MLAAPDIYSEIGSFAQMNHPIREQYHQDELWKGLMDGTINCIATDHAPHTLQEKNTPYGTAPSGMPGVETSLPLMLNQIHKGKITFLQLYDNSGNPCNKTISELSSLLRPASR